MTRREIVTKAIEKAISNGYVPEMVKRTRMTTEAWINATVEIDSWTTFLHDKGLAKALWGDTHRICSANHLIPERQDYCKECDETYDAASEAGEAWVWRWEWMLQQMVIADDPFKYLEEHALC